MKKTLAVISVIILVLIGVGTIWDFEIAKIVFMEDNRFSYIFEHLAPVVLATIITIAASLLVFTYDRTRAKKMFIMLSSIVYLLMISISTLLCVNYIGRIGLLYIGIVIVVSIILVTKLPKEYGTQARKVGASILITIFISAILVESTKPIVGRVRFRSMQDNFELFTRWYQINGDKYLSLMPAKEEIKSFPSGHSQWAGCTLTLSFLTSIKPNWKKYEKVVFIGSLIYAAIIMLSRMMQGAHFLTDVTIGFGTSYVLYLLVRSILFEKDRFPSLISE